VELKSDNNLFLVSRVNMKSESMTSAQRFDIFCDEVIKFS